MKLILVFFRAYPRRTIVMLVCLLLAGLAEGVGLSTLLPLFGLATGAQGGAHETSGFEEAVLAAIRGIGLEPTSNVLLGVIIAGVGLKAALLLLGKKQVGYSVAHMATDLRLALIRALFRMKWERYVHQPIGSLANAVASEASRASDAYLRASTILSLAMQLAVYATLAFLVSWRAMLVALVAGIGVVVLLNQLVLITRRAGARQTKVSKSLLRRLTDALQAVKPLKAMGRETLIGPLLEGETRQLNQALQRQVMGREAMRALQEPLIVLFLGIGLYASPLFVHLPLATVFMLVVLCLRILDSISKVQREYQDMVTAESAFWSLRRTIDETEAAREEPGGRGVPALRRGIRMDDVGFLYEDRWILNHVSIEVPVGQLTVVTGASGAGKTTVADLVLGLIRPQQGEVYIDEEPLGGLDVGLWRAQIGYVPQETFLLHESVALNVTLGDARLGDEDVEQALRTAGAWEFVSHLPAGMHTTVGERGLRISGGQRQRIALARALVHQPKLLILDEATASLDPATESAISTTLHGLRGELTILAICHQGPLIDLADRVYRVGDGTVVAVEPRPGPVAARG